MVGASQFNGIASRRCCVASLFGRAVVRSRRCWVAALARVVVGSRRLVPRFEGRDVPRIWVRLVFLFDGICDAP